MPIHYGDGHLSSASQHKALVSACLKQGIVDYPHAGLQGTKPTRRTFRGAPVGCGLNGASPMSNIAQTGSSDVRAEFTVPDAIDNFDNTAASRVAFAKDSDGARPAPSRVAVRILGPHRDHQTFVDAHRVLVGSNQRKLGCCVGLELEEKRLSAYMQELDIKGFAAKGRFAHNPEGNGVCSYRRRHPQHALAIYHRDNTIAFDTRETISPSLAIVLVLVLVLILVLVLVLLVERLLDFGAHIRTIDGNLRQHVAIEYFAKLAGADAGAEEQNPV
eukprot:scaffold148994_cov31-Tisochrysis_lutea.AAC.4